MRATLSEPCTIDAPPAGTQHSEPCVRYPPLICTCRKKALSSTAGDALWEGGGLRWESRSSSPLLTPPRLSGRSTDAIQEKQVHFQRIIKGWYRMTVRFSGSLWIISSEARIGVEKYLVKTCLKILVQHKWSLLCCRNIVYVQEFSVDQGNNLKTSLCVRRSHLFKLGK